MKIKSIFTTAAALSVLCTSFVSGCAGASEEAESSVKETIHTTVFAQETEITDNEKETKASTEKESNNENTTEPPVTASDQDNTSEDNDPSKDRQEEKVNDKKLSEASLEKLAMMSIEEKVAQMFAVMPEAISYSSPVTRGEELQEGINEYPLGGILLMGPNIISQEQIKELIENVQAYSEDRIGLPMFTFVDEEGGSVRRVSGKVEGISALKSAAEMAAEGDDIYQTGKRAGSYLSDLGFNVDFAPVADVVSEDSSLVIEDRSFGNDPYKVAECVTDFAKGLKEEGVMSTFKHFPGHGPTATDTHNDSAYIYKSVEELEAWDLIPFQAAIDEDAEFIMISHAAVNALDSDGTPATLSKAVITGLLKDRMGYEGIVVTDALNMGAIADHYSAPEAALMAVEAGADILLEPSDFAIAYNAVLEAVKSGEISETRVDESVGKIIGLKERIR